MKIILKVCLQIYIFSIAKHFWNSKPDQNFATICYSRLVCTAKLNFSLEKILSKRTIVLSSEVGCKAIKRPSRYPIKDILTLDFWTPFTSWFEKTRCISSIWKEKQSPRKAHCLPFLTLLTVVCIKVHKIASVWCKTALGEVGVSLPWDATPLVLLAPG